MQMCLHNGQPIYSFDVLRENNIVNLELEKRFRSGSNQGILKCSECNNPVIFKFGNLEKRIPHFAHKPGDSTKNCGYGKETEEHIEGKKILLNRMRKLYPNVYHQMRYKIKSINRYADLYFQLEDYKLIIEFQRTDLNLEVFEEKVKDYNSANINNIWIF